MDTQTKVLGTWLPIEKIRGSKHNPRKRFDPEKLKELEQSIREKGVLEPLLVRPFASDEYRKAQGKPEVYDGEFVIVAGERRYRAGKAAGLAELPCIVKEISEAEALELSVVENDQREDVHPLEQGLGYRAVLKAHNSEAKTSGAAKYDVKMLAARLGKCASFVYQRLQLSELIEPAQTAFLEKEDIFSVSHAIMIARLQPADQKSALAFVLNQQASVRNTAAWIRDNVHLLLKNASFPTDDKGKVKSSELCPGAASCVDCTKRSGAQPDLFEDIDDKDTCTDPACYHAKTKAFVTIQLKTPSSMKPEEGEKQEKRVRLGVGNYWGGRKPPEGVLFGWTPTGKKTCDNTVEGVITDISEYEHNAKYSPGEVLQVCTNSNCKIHHEPEPQRGFSNYGSGRSPAEKAMERKRKLELEVRGRIFLEMQAAAAPKALDEEQLSRIVLRLLGEMNNDEAQRLLKVCADVPRSSPGQYGGLPSIKGELLVERLDGAGLRRWAVLAAAAYDLHFFAHEKADPHDSIFSLAKSLGVNPEKVRKQVEAEHEAKKKAKGKPKASPTKATPAKAKTKKKKKTAA